MEIKTMASKLYDVIVANGEWEDDEGEEHTRWLNIGAVIKTDKGVSLKLESIPLEWNGWATLAKPNKGASKKSAKKKSTRKSKPDDEGEDFDDDIPF